MTSVIQFPTPIPMTNGNYPNLKFAVFGDNLSTVTTAGYLNQSNINSATPLSDADIIMALYSYNQQTQSGSFGIFTVSIAASNGQITLSSWANPGEVTLPTTANYLAHFTNTTGTISSAAANVTNPGNISAGLSGTAGTLSSFPSAANKGSLVLAAVANTGNTTTTISNASMGQASVISIPDPAAATANFLLDHGTNTLAAGASIVANKVNGTEAANAVTADGMAGAITTSSLTTAGGASYAITWTNTFITASSSVQITLAGGTNTVKNITVECVPGAGTATLTIYNNTAATALDGTIIMSYLVM
ncbi:hypothetical protein [Legionella micdadei]|uniref:Uncharacterized protein n=1 Tax=Legionella micdadei TaxID=451 RepID=A0A098GEQ5_LEGMI|nr:hypothetical protein [Legionella micdadei]KTD27553.1 hypothetical protein Lmic_1873 [Legionella micdadei]CEG60958.1 protein of unknown function [Legionella micdadei]SCY69519.1 hypothetical protein SAMN02982997_02529 [Legionella micdadei]